MITIKGRTDNETQEAKSRGNKKAGKQKGCKAQSKAQENMRRQEDQNKTGNTKTADGKRVSIGW